MTDPTAAVPLQARLDTAVVTRLATQPIAMAPPGAMRADAVRAGMLLPSAELLSVIAIGDRIGVGAGAVERSALTVPVAPGGTIDAQTVFEDAANAAIRYHLPAYALRYDTVRFIQTAGEGFELTAALGPLPPPDPALLPYAVPFTATLSFRLGPDVQRAVTFTEYLPEGDGTRIRFASTQPGLRSEVYWALTHPESGARITLSRAVTAAIPVQVPVPSTPPGSTPPIVVAPPVMVAIDPGVVRRAAPADLDRGVGRRPGAVMPLARPMALRARDDGDGPDIGDGPIIRDHRPPRDHPTPDWPPVEEPPVVLVTRYRVITRPVEQSAHPDREVLLFSPEVDSAVFVGVAGTGDPRVDLVPRVVDGRTYLQQSAGSSTFYYLPDELRLLRRVESPHTPLMSLSFATGAPGGGTDEAAMADLQVSLRFAVAGWTDLDRLQRDRDDLLPYVQPPPETGVDGVVLQRLDLVPERLGLELLLAGGGPIVGVRPQVSGLSLSRPVDCSVTLSPQAFQPAWAALGSGAGALITGSMTVRLDAAGISARVPLSGRIDRALATVPLLDVTDVAVRPDGTVGARLVNATESPVRLQGVTAGLVLADGAVPATFQSPPAGDLAAGAGLDVVLRAERPVAAAEAVSVALGTDGVAVLLDPGALYDAILDPTVQPVFVRQLRVKVHAAVFADPTIVALSVDVLHGRGVNVEPPPADVPRPTFVLAPEPATVAVPVKAFLLSADGELPTQVRYRVRAARVGTDDDWSDPVTDDAVGDEILITEYPPAS